MIDQVFTMYREVGVGTGEVCKCCIQANNPLSTPVSIWQVGEKFSNDHWKVMFVGKPARTKERKPTVDGFEDATEKAEDYFLRLGSAYWSYTREIVKRLYGTPEEGWKRIALSNIIKCGNSGDRDRTTDSMKVNCVDKLRVIWREIETLAPKTVVFYTSKLCDDQIDRFKYTDEWRDIRGRTYAVKNGQKSLLWWDREFSREGTTVLRLLRTSHPERQDKEGYVTKLVSWIRGDERIDSPRSAVCL